MPVCVVAMITKTKPGYCESISSQPNQAVTKYNSSNLDPLTNRAVLNRMSAAHQPTPPGPTTNSLFMALNQIYSLSMGC